MTLNSNTEMFSFTPTTNSLASGNGCSVYGGLFEKSVQRVQIETVCPHTAQAHLSVCLSVCLSGIS